MNKFILIMCSITFLSCNNKNDKSVSQSRQNQLDTMITKSSDIKTEVNLNAAGDTNNVFFNYSTMAFKIMYYKNAPQYMIIDDRRLGQGKKMSDYQKTNKGIYISFKADSNVLASFGTNYLNNLGGVDVMMNENDYGVKRLNIWKDPSNDGIKYDFSKIAEKKITAYEVKDGAIVDSFVLHK